MANFLDEVKRLSFAIERTAASEPDNEYCRSIRVMAHELGKLAAQPGAQRTVCTACETKLSESNVYCPTCGLWNPNNRR